MTSSIFTTSSPPSNSSLGAGSGEAWLEAKATRRSCCAAPGNIMEARRRVFESRPPAACDAWPNAHVSPNITPSQLKLYFSHGGLIFQSDQ